MKLFRKLVFLSSLVCLAAVGFAHDDDAFPQPHWQPQKSDPAWVAQVAQFHGHLGPWVVAGARLGMAAAKAVDAKSHFDAEVICEGPFEKPPKSCFLDGVQFGSGATLGKRTIQVVNTKSLVLRITNPKTGVRAETRPKKKLLDTLESLEKIAKPSMEQVERIARDIAAMPDEEILVVSREGEKRQ